jgi:hypothetical protein
MSEIARVPPLQCYGASVTVTFSFLVQSPALISAAANIYLNTACPCYKGLPALSAICKKLIKRLFLMYYWRKYVDIPQERNRSEETEGP